MRPWDEKEEDSRSHLASRTAHETATSARYEPSSASEALPASSATSLASFAADSTSPVVGAGFIHREMGAWPPSATIDFLEVRPDLLRSAPGPAEGFHGGGAGGSLEGAGGGAGGGDAFAVAGSPDSSWTGAGGGGASP